MGVKMITITESAVNRIASILVKEGENSKLRMYVAGKGCAGLTYKFGITTEVEDDDVIIEEGGATVLIDSMSLPYLKGLTLDFVENLTGSKFDIKNPNAKGSCGCGDSFNPY